MSVLIVSQDEVPVLLPMHECIDAMAEAMKALARGQALLPLRQMMPLPGGNSLLALMPSYLATVQALGVKAITVIPGNEGTELDAHQGAVLLFEAERGRLMGIFDATSITAIRTAAVSGLATRLLAKDDAGDLAILGSGTQARTHLEAMKVVRDLRRVRVWSRTDERARSFAETQSEAQGLRIEAVGSPEKAVRDADLVCTTTSAREPILHGRCLSPGAHVNAVGFAGPNGRELDAEAVARSRLFIDRRESCMNEAGDFLLARAEGAVGDEHIAGELGEVLIGKVDGRAGGEEITLFESLGLAIEDLAAANHIYGRASQGRAGTWLELGGRRQEGT